MDAKRKNPIWTPYVSEIIVLNKSSGILNIKYKGGEVDLDLKNTLCLLLYGSLPNLNEEVVELFMKFNVPVIYHARNISKAVYIVSGLRGANQDILTKQILFREDKRRVKYIARKLVYAKFKSLSSISQVTIPILSKDFNIEKLRNIESIYTKVYWKKYAEIIGADRFTRRSKTSVSQALDASSKFLSGIILRWITYHFMSPYHGYLHTQTTYPSLVYDLIEPYRYIMDLAVIESIKQVGVNDSFKLIANSIDILKKLLNEEIYCSTTRQYTIRQNLLHGVTIALRAYLLGYGKRFIIPIEGPKIGGRTIKTNFSLPGKSAGYSKIYVPKS